jgi:hypothetical protein
MRGGSFACDPELKMEVSYQVELIGLTNGLITAYEVGGQINACSALTSHPPPMEFNDTQNVGKCKDLHG